MGQGAWVVLASIAARIKDAVESGETKEVVVVAPHRVLGELREALLPKARLSGRRNP
jgi:protein required for attachment to host cells